MLRIVIACALVGCGGGGKSTPPPPPTPVAAPAPDAAVAEKTCDQDPEITKHAKPAFDCALEAMKRGEYDVADALAEAIMERFPYSRLSVLAEELRGDVLFARGQYAEAIEAYDTFIKYHPTHDNVEAIKKKIADAQAKSGQ